MRFAHSLSLRTRLLLLVMAVAIPFAGLAAWVILDDSRDAREQALDRARLVSSSVALRLAEVLAEHGEVLERLAQRPAVRALDASRCDPLIAEYVQLHPELTTLAVRDARGNAICSYLPGRLAPLQEDRFPWFRDGLRSDKLFAGNAFHGHLTGRWVTPLTFPIRDEAGKVAGLVVMPVDLLALARRVLRAVPENMIVEVTDRESNVLMRTGDQGAAIGKPFPADIVEQTRAGDAGTLSGTGDDGVRRLFAFTTVAGAGWRVWAGISRDEVDAVYRKQLVTGTAIVIPCLLLVLAGAWWIGTSIANPIGALASTAARVAGGHFADRVPAQGPAELAAVARQFNEMLDALDRHRADRAALSGHYEQLLKLARDIVLLVDPDGRLVEANDAAIAAYGYSADEIRSLHMRDLRSPDSLADLEQQWEASRSPGGVLFEATHRRKDGSTFPVEASARVIEIEGRPYRQSFVRDITARKQAEAAARESEARFITAVEALQEGAFIQTGGRFVYLNPLAVRMFGAARPEDLLGKPVINHFDPGSRDRVRERLQLQNEPTDAASGSAEPPAAPGGPRLDVEVSSVPFVYRGAGATLVFLRDISERNLALEELQRSERRFRTLVENVPHIAVRGYDRERRVFFWNAASEALYGFTREEAIGRRVDDLVIRPERRAVVVDDTTRWLADGVAPPSGERTLLRKDGTPITVFAGHAMLFTAGGEPEMYCIDIDLTALKQAEAQTAEWRNRYAAAILASGQLVQEWDPQTNALSIVGDTERVLGMRHDELEGSIDQWRELIHPEDRAAFDTEVARATTGGTPFHQHYRIRRADGAWLVMQDDGYFVRKPSGEILRMVCFVRDVTESSRTRQRIEEQLDELRRWHAAMLGREARVIELKREVNELLATAGEAPRYGVTGPESLEALA